MRKSTRRYANLEPQCETCDGAGCGDCMGEPHEREDDEGYYLGTEFASPGGVSALRAATASNPRNLPCPTCRRPNMLTPKDRALGYQCDRCADRAERGMDF